jgi:hypothetical protein
METTMSEKSSLNDGETLKQKLEAAGAGEFPQRVMRSRNKSPLTFPMIGALLVLAGTAIVMAASFPWLLQQPREMVVPISAGAVILIIAANITLSVLNDRRTDEWHRNAVRFSSQWGYGAGLALALLLIFPLSAWIESWAPGRYRDFVQLGFMFAFVAVMVAQAACVALLHLAWTLWKSRSARGPHEEQD